MKVKFKQVIFNRNMGIREIISALNRGPVLLFIVTALFFSASAFASGVDASDKRLVSIFADGNKKTIATAEGTVGSVLESVGITLNNQDLVEPTADTEINGDVFKINVFRARPYTIIDGDKEIDVFSAYQSPRLIAESSGIEVFPEDDFRINRIDDIVSTGMIGQQIEILRATPIKLNVYGTEVVYRTHAETVGEVLGEKSIELAEGDVVAPEAGTAVKRDMKVSVISVGNSSVAVEEDIPFPSERIYDSSIDAGLTSIQQAGSNGRKLVTYEVITHNGQEAGRTELQSVVISEPTPEIKVVGTKSASPGSNIATGQEMAAAKGWTGDQWGCLYELWIRESGWSHLTWNYAGSGAYGIPQALPGSKMASAGADWETNPKTQIRWGLGYIQGRYGSPCAAWDHSNAVGWY